jgi:hypothetical protein
MNCKDINKNLIFYLEKGLSGEKEKEFAAHLEICTDCSRLFAYISESFKTLELKEEIEPKAFFAESVLGKISQEKSEKETVFDTPLFDFFFVRYFKEIMYSAIMIIIIVTTVFYLTEGSFSFNFLSDSDVISTNDVTVNYLDN